MKRLRTNSAWARKKYSSARHQERAGVGVRMLTEAEIQEFQSHVDRVISGKLPKLRQWCSLLDLGGSL